MRLTIILGLVALTATSCTSSGDWELTGEIGAELRVFPESAAGSTDSDTATGSVYAAPELVHTTGSGADRFTLQPFARYDTGDTERSHFDVRALNWLHTEDSWSLLVGAGKVFWGVTESRHLVDVVNQTDAIENLDGEDKLGQPMVNLTLDGDFGAIDLFYLPMFRERTFADDDARLRGALPISQTPTYDSGAEEFHQDWALRWSQSFDALDVGVAHFSGTSREPTFDLESGPVGPFLRPRYEVIDQTSLDLQWTVDAWLWKLEALTRGGHGSRFAAMVAGVEHTHFGVFGGDGDLGLLAEVLLDGRGSAAPPTLFDNDVFLGFRFAANDVADTSVVGGPILDLETGEILIFAEGQRRLGDHWRLEIEARAFLKTDRASPTAGLRRDHHVVIALGYYF